MTVPTILVEEDPILRLVGVILDPETAEQRRRAFADYMAHDVPDFAGWCRSLRHRLPGLYPARVRPVATQEALLAELPEADALVIGDLRIGAAELAVAGRLACIQRFGTRDEGIDLAACARRGIVVRHLRRRSNRSVAEHTLAAMLTLARRLPHATGLVTAGRLAAAGRPLRPYDRSHVPGGNFGRIAGLVDLRGATLGLVGFGEIGREVAVLARAFGMELCYHARRRLPADDERHWGVTWCGREELFACADFLSVHVPLDDTTRGMIGAALLARMKPGAFLVNMSRADIVDRAALLAALAEGPLGGCAIDALYSEPMADDDPLLRSPKLVLTPHIAGGPRSNNLGDMEEMLEGIRAALRPS